MSEFKKVECTCSHGYTCRNMQDPNCCAHNCDYNDLVDALSALQAEHDALALENKKLKMFGAEVDAIMRNQDNIWSRQISALCEKVDFAINQDIKLLLAAHDAEVAAKAVLEFAAKLLVNSKVDAIDFAKVESDKLRAKDKQ